MEQGEKNLFGNKPLVERSTHPQVHEQATEYLLRHNLETEEEKDGLEIVQILQNAGYDAYFVGGYVRDVFNGDEPHDIDIATNAPPKIVEEMFSTGGLKGNNFGVNIHQKNGKQFEIATFRSEGNYQDGRHPENVELVTDVFEDAKRRDFTINAMYFNPVSKKVIDFFGGLDDLQNKKLKFVGEPEKVLNDQAAVAKERIIDEDYLRILRAVRFASRFDLEIDDDVWQVMHDNVDLLEKQPKETIKNELNKMFLDDSREQALELLDKLGVLKKILPEIETMKGVEQPEEFHAEGDVFVHTKKCFTSLTRVFAEENQGQSDMEVVWATLLHDVGKPSTFSHQEGDRIRFNKHEVISEKMTGDILNRLRFSNEFKKNVKWLTGNHMFARNFKEMRPAKQKSLALHKLMPQLLMVMKADYYGSLPLEMESFDETKEIYETVKQKGLESERRKLAEILSGKDIIQVFDIKEGPVVGLMKKIVQEAYLSGIVKNKEEAIDLLKDVESQLNQEIEKGLTADFKDHKWREQVIASLLKDR